MPDYAKGLVNVVSSIMRYFGVKNMHKTLPLLDKKLNDGKYRNVVLVLFDGLGYNILKQNKDICSFLYENLVDNISSTFPSTTMAARTTVESGLNPVEHGWLGWDMYFKEFDKVITLTKNVIKGTKIKPANYHVARTLLNYESIVDKIDKKEGCLARKITVYSNHKNESLAKMRRRIKLLTLRRKKTYVYAYYNEPDHVMHKYGTNSNEMKEYLRLINKEFKKLCTILKNTLVIGIADHGHINVNYVNISDYPSLSKMLNGSISIDNRACAFKVKKEYIKEFPLALKQVLKDDFIIMSKEEIIKNKLYGDGEENKYFNDGLGDFFAIGIKDKAIRYDSSTNKHKSGHSGLTEDEMLVPLIIVNTNSL